MSTVVADLQARLSFSSTGSAEVAKEFDNIARAQDALLSKVESSSAVYQELKLNVVEAAQALNELEEAQKRVAQTKASTTLVQATVDLEMMENQLAGLNKELEIFTNYQKAGADDFQMAGLVEGYGHTREELQSLIIEQERMVDQGKLAVSAFEDQSSAAGDLVRAEADLEQATNRLVAAQEKLAAQGMPEGVSGFITEAVQDLSTVQAAHEALGRSVEDTSAKYRMLAQSTAESLQSVIDIRDAIDESAAVVINSGMSYQQLQAVMASMETQVGSLTTEIEKLEEAWDATSDDAALASIEERINALNREKTAIEEQIEVGNQLAVSFGELSQGGAELIDAEAKLEANTNKLVKAQMDAAGAAEAMGEGNADLGDELGKTSGQMRSASTRMNYYIQSLASGNIGQTLIGQSASLAGSAVQKLSIALASGATAGEKLSSVTKLMKGSLSAFLTPATAAIAVVSVAIILWQQWKKEQEEFTQATYAATRALQDTSKTLDETTLSLVKTRIEAKKLYDEFEAAGIGIFEFSHALADTEAYDTLISKLNEAASAVDEIDDAVERVGGSFDFVDEWASGLTQWIMSVDDGSKASARLRDDLIEMGEQLEAAKVYAELAAEAEAEFNAQLLVTADYATLVARDLVRPWQATQDLTAALGDVNAMIALLAGNDPKILEELENLDATSVEELVTGLDMLADTYPQFTGMVSKLNGLLSEEERRHLATAASIREQRDAARESVDAGFAMTQSLSRLYDAQVAYENAPSGESVVALGQALSAATWAAQNLTEGMGPSIDMVAKMAAQGWITAEAAAELTAWLLTTGGVAAELGATMDVAATQVANEGNAAAVAAGQNSALAGSASNAASGVSNIIGPAYAAGDALIYFGNAAAYAASSGNSSGTGMGSRSGGPGRTDFAAQIAAGNSSVSSGNLGWGNPGLNSGSLANFGGYKGGGSGGSGGSGGGGGSTGGTTDDKGLAIEEIKKFFEQVNKAIKSGIQGGVLYSDAGNAVPVGGPQDFITNDGGVNIQTINLRGVWDFADPAAKREIVRQLQEALAQFESEVS